MQRTLSVLTTIIMLTMIVFPTHAHIQRGDDGMIDPDGIFNNLEDWLAAVPPVTVIDFTDYAADTIITDQYSDLGINFTNGTDFILETSSFVDGHGLANNTLGDATIRIVFHEPLTIFGSLYVGLTWYFFYHEGELIGWTGQGCGASIECFAGFILDTPFDEVHIHDFAGTPAVDNLYFTFAPIPAPGALALLGIAGFAFRRSRRRR